MDAISEPFQSQLLLIAGDYNNFELQCKNVISTLFFPT